MIRLNKIMVLLFLMLLALPLASRAKDTFYIEPVNVVPGESKTITLNLDNSQVFRGFQTDIELPEGLKIASKSNGNLDISLTDRGSSSFSVSSNLMSDGSVRILGYSTQGESIKGNQGALVRISVRASSDFSGGYIKLKNSIFSDVNNRDVKLDNSQLFVGTKEQNDVSVKGGEISPEVSKAFSFELSNESEMTAFQMDVVLPNGLSLDLNKTRLTGRCGNHRLQTKQLGNGKVRIICMSSDNTSISGKLGSVIDLWIKAEKGITGNQIVKLENIIFSDVKARTYRMDPFSFVVDVKYVPVTSVSISESNMQLEVSDSRQLTASLLPENCTDKTILWKSDNEKVATVSDNGMIIARSAGQCSIIASTADNLIQAKCVVTVVKIPLTAHVANTTKVYGDANPEFNITYSGFRDGDSEVGFSVPASISTIVDNSSKVGKYDIVASGAVSDKYEISYIPGTLTITKAPLSISAGNYTKKQGDAMPVFKASYAGFKNGENESVLTKQPVFSCEANEASVPAEYAVTISGADAENYDISYEQGRLTVVEADAVVVRAKSYSRQYGDENPVFEFETEGAALDGTPEIVCSAVANSPVGSYTIEVKQGSIKNYNVHFESGSLVITKAPLSISAGNYTKKQGDAMPVFKASYAGFKNGENESVLTKQPVFSCEANEASAPAEYAVTISGADAENYDISYEQGRLTVVEADAVVVRAKSYSRQYGDENPVFEFETEGAALDGTPEIVCSAVANSPVGSYTIEVKQGSIKNYNVHFESGSLVITKAPLSISAGNYTKKQGDAMPVFKASYAGFKNGEDESVLTKQPVFSCEANETSVPAEYAVTISGADAENYDISYEQGCLTVVEADAVVVRAKSYNRQYGDENPVFEFETEGAALDGTPEIVCSAVANSPVGSYTIEVKQGSIKNYNVHFESGSLVITKAPLSISAGNYTKKQGDAMPVFKASYVGFKNGEDESVLTKQPVFSCEANEASAPAEYSVTISGADAENYEISYEQGVLTVTGMPKPIISTDEATLRITTETDNAVIYYTLDGTEPNENARKYTEPINLYASCEIKAIAVKGDAKSEVSSAEYHDAEYPNIVKVGDIITANIINNGEENLPMIFKVTSVYPFNVEMENKEDYVEGWNNERDVSGTLEIPVVVKSNGISCCVKKLGDNSLARCVNVSSLKLNEGLESIGHQAIRWCRNIKELIVPNSVKEVWGAFLTEDHGLVSVVLGAGLETIHTDAFWGVSMNLKSFISLSTNPAKCVEPDRTFTSLPEDVTLYVPLGSKSAYETAPGWDYFAGHIVEMDMSPATIKVRNCSREYGDDNPTLEFETEGATLIGEPEIICSADKNSKVGTYEIEINKGTIKNYLVTFVPGTLTVTKAPLVVTAENYTITQGDKLPEFTANYSGFKNGEDESVLTKQPVFSCDANEASAPGEYPINIYGVEADNYNAISYVAGTLTVLKRELKKQTITWDQEIKAKVGSTIEMNATASSGLPVRYSFFRAPEVINAYRVPQIEGNNITFPEEGTYMLVAIQDGNNEYAAATDTLDVCAISDDEGLMYIGGIYYKYTDDGSALKVVRGYNPYRGKVEIPATVNGLPVTEVDGLAMYACYYLKELVIGDNVKKCGHEAFGASINLCNVTLPVADVEFAHNWMFNCDRGIREIHCRSSIPYVVDEGIFNGAVDYDKCILYVPVGTKQAYRNAEVWKYFTHIVEENVSTSISNINVEKKSVWYTLQGVKLFVKPNIPGVYIHNGKKIIVR
ncbi:MAG: hypothetical protein EGR93_05780 [Prevotella sp.]|nr:hypothetical protein [Prevotella sp.]